MQVEKMNFEAKEDRISMDGLKEANSELTTELDDVKQQLLEARMSARENGTLLDEKERLKRERMATMLAGFDLGDFSGENERSIRHLIDDIDALENKENVSPTELQDVRRKLLETQGIVRQAELSVLQRGEQEEAASLRREALEQRLAKVQQDYEAVLEGKLDGQDIETELGRRIRQPIRDRD
jgi:kinesin family member 5